MLPRKGNKTLATELRHRIWVQSFTRTTDGEGGYTTAWVNSQQIWAAIYPIRALQHFEFKSVGVDATHAIKIRGDITIAIENRRFKFGERVFEILSIEDGQERGIVKWVTCQESR